MSKILCVEDDHFIADMYAHALKKAGYDVTVISNGAEALKELKQTVYDVVLLDIMLPDKTGVEILNELRGPKGEGLPHTKIIVTTNFEEADEDRSKLEALADGYLIKAEVIPSKMVELVKQITG
ncbi:response regulator [Candidatus Nomurabacteria bacterium]|nr:response regulator [Candidatus Nomurabacteria bacterium]